MTFSVPTKISADVDSVEYITEICLENQYKHCVIVSGKHAQAKGDIVERLTARLKQASISSAVLPPVRTEPTSEEVDRLFSTLERSFVEVVISIGGGSAIDCGKMLALLISAGGSAVEYENGKPIPERLPPHIVVPTTSGSGSEVTPYAVINNSDTGRKFTIGSKALCPTYALLDPAVLLSMPRATTLATGIDAWIQLFEAYTSTKADPFQAPLILAGAKMLYENLGTALEEPVNENSRLSMAIAACYGGVAITNARTGLIHTISVAVAQHYKLDHGWLNGVIAFHVLPYNLKKYTGRLTHFMEAATGRSFETEAMAAQAFLDWLSSLSIPQNLGHLDIPTSLVPTLMARINQDGGLRQVNPKAITNSDLERILLALIGKETA